MTKFSIFSASMEYRRILEELALGKTSMSGTRLLSEAEAVNADSLIMGAFRFGELYEWVFRRRDV